MISKKIIAINVLALTLAIGGTSFTPAAYAIEQNNSINMSSTNNQITDESTMEVVDLVTIFSPYVKINSSNEVYLTKTAAEIGVSQSKYDTFMKGIQLENESIKKGDLSIVFDENGKAIDVTSNLNIQIVEGKKPINPIKSRIAVANHWYGWQLQLTESETLSLEKALAVGSGAAWLAGELSAAGIVSIPASIPMGIIAASGGLGAATIAAADQGNGISFYFNIQTRVGWLWPND